VESLNAELSIKLNKIWHQYHSPVH